MKQAGFYKNTDQYNETVTMTASAPASASLSGTFNAFSNTSSAPNASADSSLNAAQVMNKITGKNNSAPKTNTASLKRDPTKAASDIGAVKGEANKARQDLDKSKGEFDQSVKNVKTDITNSYKEAATNAGFDQGDAMNALTPENGQDMMIKGAGSMVASTAAGVPTGVSTTVDIATVVGKGSKVKPSDVQDLMATAVRSLSAAQETKQQEVAFEDNAKQSLPPAPKMDYSKITGEDAITLVQTPDDVIADQAGFGDAYAALDDLDANHLDVAEAQPEIALAAAKAGDLQTVQDTGVSQSAAIEIILEELDVNMSDITYTAAEIEMNTSALTEIKGLETPETFDTSDIAMHFKNANTPALDNIYKPQGYAI